MKRTITFMILLLVSGAVFAQLNAEQAAIKKVFVDFLDFYKKQETRFNSFKLYKGKGKDNNPPYHIQWKEVERYFAYLRKEVPYVGEAYIKAEQQHFKDSEKSFKDYPDEELPAGFDYDRWAGGQESIEYTYKWYTAKTNTYKVIITGNKAILKIGSGSGKDIYWSVVPFAKENGQWKMADNVYPAESEN